MATRTAIRRKMIRTRDPGVPTRLLMVSMQWFIDRQANRNYHEEHQEGRRSDIAHPKVDKCAIVHKHRDRLGRGAWTTSSQNVDDIEYLESFNGPDQNGQ